MAVGATVFGYVIGNVSALADLVDPESTKYSEKMERVRQERERDEYFDVWCVLYLWSVFLVCVRV
jgi:hypothetical protein